MKQQKNKLSSEIQKTAKLEYLGDLYWTEKDIRDVINIVIEEKFAILGGEVLKVIDDGKYDFTGDNWYSNKDEEETWEDFVQRSKKNSFDYIDKHFKGSALLFTITFVDEEKYSQLDSSIN